MREHIFLRRFTWGPSLFIFVLRFIDKVSILEICVFVGLAPLEKDLFNTISNLKKYTPAVKTLTQIQLSHKIIFGDGF